MRSTIDRGSRRRGLSTVLPLCILAAWAGSRVSSSAAVSGGDVLGARSPAPLALDSGIRGLLVFGPLPPSSRVGADGHERLLQTTLDIVNAEDGSRVRQVRTAPNGSFVVGLAPGSYIVRSASTDEVPRPSVAPVQVTVTAHVFVAVTILADTGIR